MIWQTGKLLVLIARYQPKLLSHFALLNVSIREGQKNIYIYCFFLRQTGYGHLTLCLFIAFSAVQPGNPCPMSSVALSTCKTCVMHQSSTAQIHVPATQWTVSVYWGVALVLACPPLVYHPAASCLDQWLEAKKAAFKEVCGGIKVHSQHLREIQPGIWIPCYNKLKCMWLAFQTGSARIQVV